MIFELLWLYLLEQVLAQNFLSWKQNNNNFADAYLIQRNLGGLVPIDQITTFGVSVNQLLFNDLGYLYSVLPILKNLLQLQVGVVSLDVYWNEYSGKWQLCPAPFPANLMWDDSRMANVSWNGRNYRCLVDMSLVDVFNEVASYLHHTNTELNANMVQMVLNPKTITSGSNEMSDFLVYNAPIAAAGSNSLSDCLGDCIGYLYAPSILLSHGNTEAPTNYTEAFGSKYPTRDAFLFKLLSRVMVYILDEAKESGPNSYRFTSRDEQYFFIANNGSFNPWVVRQDDTELLSTFQNIYNSTYNSSYFQHMAQSTDFRLAFDSDAVPFSIDSIKFWAQTGFTPILNASFYDGFHMAANNSQILTIMNNTIPSELWSWSPGQPQNAGPIMTNYSRSELSENDSPQWAVYSESHVAFRCVSMSSQGWAQDNCYAQYRYACRNKTNPFMWTLSERIQTYFTSVELDPCPEGFEFGVPELALEQFSLLSLLESTDIHYPIWIDLNDIYLPNCFATGGPNAECLQKKVLTTTSLVGRIAPSLVVSLVLILLIFLEHVFNRTPIQTNRVRHWKKAVAQYYKENDFEGVPS